LSSIKAEETKTKLFSEMLAKKTFYFKSKVDQYEIKVCRFHIDRVIGDRLVPAQIIVKKFVSTKQIMLCVITDDADDTEYQQGDITVASIRPHKWVGSHLVFGFDQILQR
jgi:hypothetical protein